MVALRRRLARDSANLSLADAMITFIVLSIAAVVLWRGSLAPVAAAEDTARSVEHSQIMAMAAALLRLSIDEVDVLGTGAPRTESVPTLLTQLLDETREAGGSLPAASVPVAQKILDNATQLGLGRWTIGLDVTDPGDLDASLCLRHATGSAPGAGRLVEVHPGRCDTPAGSVVTQAATLPSGYQTIIYVTQEASR